MSGMGDRGIPLDFIFRTLKGGIKQNCQNKEEGRGRTSLSFLCGMTR